MTNTDFGSVRLALGRRLLQEQDEWSEFVRDHFGAGAVLLYVSGLDSDRRIYRRGDRIAKIVRRRAHAAQQERWFGQDLTREFSVLRTLDRSHADFSPSLESVPGWQVLTMNYIEGQSWSQAWVQRGIFGRLRLLGAAAAALERAHRAGLCHRDVTSHNIKVLRNGKAVFVDWGNASACPPLSARLGEYRTMALGRHRVLQRAARRTGQRFAPWLHRLYRRAKLRSAGSFSMHLADEQDAAPFREQLGHLEDAWRSSARWNSELGEWLAYPSLTVAGAHFRGQRPWLLRWNRISDAVDFRGKAVVDVGSNLGLFTSASMLAGARSAVGIEFEPQLVEAARTVAVALGSGASFIQADLGGERQWEAEVGGADMVLAMSIMEWVPDRPRLLTFIGRHREVLYEGHESLSAEFERLRSVGFSEIRLVMVSELGRALLYGRKP